jgi:hypothetical protein
VEPAGVKSTAVETAAVKPAAVETAAVKPAKSAAVEAAAVETPSAAVPSAPVRCVGEIWLAENSHAQQCSGNTNHTRPFAGPGSAIA